MPVLSITGTPRSASYDHERFWTTGLLSSNMQLVLLFHINTHWTISNTNKRGCMHALLIMDRIKLRGAGIISHCPCVMASQRGKLIMEIEHTITLKIALFDAQRRISSPAYTNDLRNTPKLYLGLRWSGPSEIAWEIQTRSHNPVLSDNSPHPPRRPCQQFRENLGVS